MLTSAEKCASDVNSQASAPAEINSATLLFPMGTHAAQIRWLCAVMYHRYESPREPDMERAEESTGSL